MTRYMMMCAPAALAAGIVLLPAAASANCAWSIALLEKELSRVQESLPLARAAGKDTGTRVTAALDFARENMAVAQSHANAGREDACQQAVSDARSLANQARVALARGQKG